MRFSIALQTDKTLDEYGALAALVERQGFDMVSVYNDLFFQPAWLPLLAMAQQTRRIELSVVAVNPFTCHPINIAGNAALVDEASGGRLTLGMARGAWLDALGIEPSRPIGALREAIEVVRQLLAGDASGFEGAHFRVPAGQGLRWRPYRPRLPILLGSWGEKTIAATADLIDEVKVGGTANPAMARVMRERIDRHAGGRAIGLVVGAVTVVDEERRAALALARREVAMYLPVVAALDTSYRVDPEEIERVRAAVASGDVEAATRAIGDETLQRFAFAGTPADIERQVGELAEAGATRIEFGTPHGQDEVEGLRLLARVMVGFRSRD